MPTLSNRFSFWLMVMLAWPVVRGAQAGDLLDNSPPLPVRAALHAERDIIQAGQPVWVEFTLTNLSAEPVRLQIPGAEAVEEATPAEQGLPAAHVFSGVRFTGVSIKDAHGDDFDAHVTLRPHGLVPVVRLAAHGSVGLRLELTQFYESLKRPGKYTVSWRPYGAALESAPLSLQILSERQAVIHTDLGLMTMRFYYEQAPQAVQNFIELAEKRFYNNLSFHKVIAGGFIQGGDPRGDGHGIRADGKRLKAEFSTLPFEMGTVGMARLPSDPDSASCQFFICLSRQPLFDGEQTAFGYLVGDSSFETLNKIAAVPTDARYRPSRKIAIRAITLENVPPPRQDVLSARTPATRPAGAGTVSGRAAHGLSQLDPPAAPTTRPGEGAGG